MKSKAQQRTMDDLKIGFIVQIDKGGRIRHSGQPQLGLPYVGIIDSAVVEGFENNLDQYYAAIEYALCSYTCQYTMDEDGSGLDLIDVLTPPGDDTIQNGKKERDLLIDHVISTFIDRNTRK